STGVLTSGSPAPINPAVAVFFYQGNLGLGNGVPQNVYSLDARQIQTGALRHVGSATLTPGQSKSLPGGVRVTFDGYTQWVNFQISHNPGQNYLLLAVLAMVFGLICSLTIRRRRIWLRLTPDTDDGTLRYSQVEVGGLARSDSGNFTAEFTAVLTRLRDTAVTADAEQPREGAHR
ncbi:MAG: cytochrome c biogenesis protein ResB, partial [Actinobacteria bacterium]|nr:cytochrome c biogenesis protein ResB [Actinomycetota bacterium]